MFGNSNRRHFQKGLDADKQRALRRDSELSLRRKQREEHLQKRRRRLINNNNNNLSNGNNNYNDNEPMPDINDVNKYVGMVLQVSSLELNLKGTIALRKLLSKERDPPTHKICETGVIPKIISFMYNNINNNNNNNDLQNQLQLEAAWVLTNIGASTTEFVSLLVKNNAIEAFVHLFRTTKDPLTADQAIWGLGNIAGDQKRFKDRILKTGFLNDIVSNIFDLSEDMQKNTMWTLSNLFRWKDPVKICDIHETVQVLNRFLKNNSNNSDQDSIVDCIWTLNYISRNPTEGIINYLVNKTTIIQECMKLLDRERGKYEIYKMQKQQRERKQNSYFVSNINNNNNNEGNNNNNNQQPQIANIHKEAILRMNDKIYRPCLRLLGNILSEPDELTQFVLDAGYLDIIQPYANHFISNIRREVMWSFSNILAGNHQQIESLISREPLLISIINAGMYGKLAVKKEACWCICNAMADSITTQKKKLVEYGSIEVLAGMLNPEYNLRLSELQMLLEGIESILSLYGGAGSTNPYAEQFEELHGLDNLERIQADENLSESVYNLIVNLMTKYYGTVDEITYNDAAEGELLNAKIDTKTNQFAFGVGNISNNNFRGNANNPFGSNNNNRQTFQF